jgi:hypothetical protein
LSLHLEDLKKGQRINSGDGYGYDYFRVLADAYDDGAGWRVKVRRESDGEETEFFYAHGCPSYAPYVELIPEDLEPLEPKRDPPDPETITIKEGRDPVRREV